MPKDLMYLILVFLVFSPTSLAIKIHKISNSCVERYRYRLEKMTDKKFFATKTDLKIAWGVLALPYHIAISTNRAYNTSQGASKVFPAIGTIAAPILIFPFSTSTAFILTLASPIVMIGDGIHYATKKHQRKKIKYLIKLMSDLEAYTSSQEIGPHLEKLLHSEEVLKAYDDPHSALLDLTKAYQLNYFCQKIDDRRHRVYFMTLEQILRNIQFGRMHEFVEQQ
jgi:hypothetical protein